MAKTKKKKARSQAKALAKTKAKIIKLKPIPDLVTGKFVISSPHGLLLTPDGICEAALNGNEKISFSVFPDKMVATLNLNALLAKTEESGIPDEQVSSATVEPLKKFMATSFEVDIRRKIVAFLTPKDQADGFKSLVKGTSRSLEQNIRVERDTIDLLAKNYELDKAKLEKRYDKEYGSAWNDMVAAEKMLSKFREEVAKYDVK